MTPKSPSHTQSTFVVIYQMGKVASTSLTASLNELDGVEAVQSHFLGDAALKAIVPTLTGANVSDYFFNHQIGQFIENTKTTRRIYKIRAGQSEERLVIISLARDPFEWARSSVTQDIMGYLPTLERLPSAQTLDEGAANEIIESGLRMILGDLAVLIDQESDVEACFSKAQRGALPLKDTVFASHPDTLRLFFLFMRPFVWFQQHYEVALGIKLEDMERSGDALEHHDDHLDMIILRYESFEADLGNFLQSTGLPPLADISSKNVSKTKEFAAPVNAAFASPEGERIAHLFRTSTYAKTFGYS